MESGSRSSGRRVKLALRSLSNVGIILREIFKIGVRVVDYFGKILYSFRGGDILLLANLVSRALMQRMQRMLGILETKAKYLLR